MKILTTLFLIAGLSAVALGQQAPAAEGPPGVTVLKCGWSRERVPGWENSPGGAEPYEVMMARVANEQRLQRARNSGDRPSLSRSENEAKLYEKATTNKTTKSDAKKATGQLRFGYRYKISVRNGGEKTIKLIDWDYVFLDPLTRSEIERHLFTSEEKIGPGKEKELSVFNLAPPTRTVSAGALGKAEPSPFVERIVLVRVEYSDGTVWQNQ